jgi:hypothetical protein
MTTRKLIHEGRYTSLREAVLSLSSADLSSADLSGADLSGADLSSADLSSADLSSADLSGADLRGAYLSGASLSGADLSGASLSSADLIELPVGDPRGYRLFATLTADGEWRFFAGCHGPLTLESALAQWSKERAAKRETDYGEIACRYRYALTKWWASKPAQRERERTQVMKLRRMISRHKVKARKAGKKR